MEPGFPIGEVAARSEVTRKALRLYESPGILPPPRPTRSGYWVYSSDVLEVSQLHRWVRQSLCCSSGTVRGDGLQRILLEHEHVLRHHTVCPLARGGLSVELLVGQPDQ
jgi:MerR family regulatory protein